MEDVPDFAVDSFQIEGVAVLQLGVVGKLLLQGAVVSDLIVLFVFVHKGGDESCFSFYLRFYFFLLFFFARKQIALLIVLKRKITLSGYLCR
jgi:hypothetical protein